MKCQVLLSTYNGERYIRNQLDTIFGQKDVEVSLLVRDDGSQDSTTSIVKEYSKAELKNGPNIGIVKSYFELIKQSGDTFDFYALADQDDHWQERKLTAAYKLLKSEPEDVPLLYCSNLTVVDEHLVPIRSMNNKRIHPNINMLLIENFVTGCTIVFNNAMRSIFIKNIEDSENIIMHDWWLALIAQTFGKIIYDPNSYILYRQHQHNQIGAFYKNKPLSAIVKRIKKANIELLAQIDKYNSIFKTYYGCNFPGYEIVSSCHSFYTRLHYSVHSKIKCSNIIGTVRFYILYILGYYTLSNQDGCKAKHAK